jgi:uncharacterized protein (TIGR02996 family)
MMTEEDAFLHAIREQPDDDTVRLVYADWLAENGQPDRGEFIRVQIELACTPPTEEADERRRRVLLDRQAELLKKHKTVWLAPFLPYAKESSFKRGFVHEIDVPANTFLQQAEKWFAIAPLTRVKFTNSGMWDRALLQIADTLFTSPHLSRLEAITLEQQGLRAEHLESLATHPDLSRLRELVLAWNELRNEGVTVLANMPQLRHLESLDLRGNGITDVGARAMAQSEYFGRLKELRMTRNPIRNRSWDLLTDRFPDALG